MTREIKFRAWHREAKSMITVFQWNKGDEKDSVTRLRHFNGIETLFIGEDCDLMQFTGLNDKNDSEIYEGDIVKAVKKRWQGFDVEESREYFNNVVEWWCGGMGVGFRIRGKRWHKMLTKNMVYNLELEVIGNIYENPEL